MYSLLDVNILIALLDENHLHHPVVCGWLDGHIGDGWASCPMTQNGCVRILSQPSYPNALGVAETIRLLREACSTQHHRFVADDASLLDSALVESERLLSARQITDVYLLALAVAHGMRFVTLDRSIPVNAVSGADERSLVVLEPSS